MLLQSPRRWWTTFLLTCYISISFCTWMIFISWTVSHLLLGPALYTLLSHNSLADFDPTHSDTLHTPSVHSKTIMVFVIGLYNQHSLACLTNFYLERLPTSGVGGRQADRCTDLFGWREQKPESFLCRMAGLSLRDRVRSSVIQEELRVELLLLHVEKSQLPWWDVQGTFLR